MYCDKCNKELVPEDNEPYPWVVVGSSIICWQCAEQN
jgi:RNase P subunit RPR2